MASPFASLRRHQKTLLAIFGVIIMFVFVVGSGLDSYITGRGQTPVGTQVLVNWKYGSLSDQEIAFMRHKHQVVMRFLEDILKLSRDRKGTPLIPNVMQNELGQIVPGLRRCNTTADFVQTLVLAKKADQMGLVVDDAAVKEYLLKLGGEKLDEGDFARIIDGIPNRRLTAQQVFDELRLEMKAQDVLNIMGRGLATTSPAAAWENFQRLHHRVQCEVLPIPVADYLDKVSEPSHKEALDFYNEHKNNFAHPDFPDPGFRQRLKASFEYLKVDFNQFLEAEKAKLTDEQLRAEYELRVSRGEFKMPELPPENPAAEKPAAEKPAGEKPEAEKPATEKPATEKPATEKPADEKPEAEKPAGEKPAAEKPAGEKPETEKPAEQKPCQDKPATENTEKPAAEKPAAEKPVDEKPSAEKPAAEKPADEKPADEKPAAEKPAAEKPAAEKPAAEKPAAEKPADEKPAVEKPAAKYRPFEDVRNDLATSMARPKAQEARKKITDQARKEIDAYARYYRNYALLKGTPEEQNLEKVEFDPRELAKRLNLVYGQTPLVDPLGIGEFELGKGANFSFAGGSFNQVSFAEVAYQPNVPLYRVEQIMSQENPDIEFLYWKVEEEPAKVPEFDAVKDEVIRQWKMQRALKFAQTAAEELAKQAADKPSLTELAPEKAQTTNEFSFMSTGAVPFSSGAPSLSRVDNVQAAGLEFMEAVFKLKVGEVGVAVNQPKSTVYVVRVAAESPSEQALRDRFINAGIANREVMFLASLDRRRQFAQWYQDLEKEMQVKWVGNSDQFDVNAE